MIFERLVVSHTRDCINAVLAQDVPFERGMISAEGEVCEIFDLGVVEDHAWTDRNGATCSVSRHIHERLEDAGTRARDLLERRVSAELHVEGLDGLAALLDVRRILDAPCTIETIKDRLRARGLAGIPVVVRAWLATVLPDHHVDAMGVARGVSISAMKAAERLRNKRDPLSGSRLQLLERIAQRQSDAHAAARLRRKQRDAEAAQLAASERLASDPEHQALVELRMTRDPGRLMMDCLSQGLAVDAGGDQPLELPPATHQTESRLSSK